MTWGEFKEMLQQRGVTDDTPIDHIDVYPAQWGGLDVFFDGHGAVSVLDDFVPKGKPRHGGGS